MKLTIRLILILLVATTTWNCEEDEENTNELIGTWLMVAEEISYCYGDYSGTLEATTDYSIDNYYNASIFKFGENQFTEYYNFSTADYASDIRSYTHDDEALYSSYVYEGQTVTDTMYYFLDSDQLTIEMRYESGDNYQYNKFYFEEYNGEIPPDSWTSALGTDSFEFDDDASTANIVQVGANEKIHTLPLGDIDWFKFDATAGNSYLILVRSNMDNILKFYDTDGSTLVDQDDDNDWDLEVKADAVESAILFDCTNSGTYYYTVAGFYSSYHHGYYATSVSYYSSSMGKQRQVKQPALSKSLDIGVHRSF